ncbi:DUF1614 domain-containing protein [Methylocystis sp. Sn-Cys]|uniref:DUF1614 domain-containing protein n=1 Tax=Methylocystis sp. Sn-Cys TaxID=1701263 RepID=UPI0019242A75|nr:DUF1614 domain-containing protein [Methylocystis sp. Sn-Cys]MBL1258036.1 DUF1614 domain-containing protein [Methylocystis sp. Sn-Cys]
MHFSDAQYLPIAAPAFALLAGVVVVLVILVELRILKYAYMQLGVSSGTAVFLLLASLLGSYINIPVATLGSEPIIDAREVVYYGVPYVVPRFVEEPQVILAVNVGGAVIPTVLSIFLLSRNAIWIRGALAVACVAAISYALAEPVRGVGIALPIFVAPLAATIIAAIISWRHLAPLAYASGSLGVLVGADLLNFDKLAGLGTPVLSIGGAGTFDGIFLTGVLSVLLASLIGGRTQSAVQAS